MIQDIYKRAVVAACLSVMLAPAHAQTAAEAPTLERRPPPSLNFYGVPGLLDMPSGEMLPDGEFTTTVSWFGGNGRATLTFQALPWLSASFRYNSINDWNLGSFSTYFDRGFDVRFRLLKETNRRPSLTLGLQDFVGTGIYASEYIVATKNFDVPGLSFGGGQAAGERGQLKLTGGVGWGRLGTANSFGSPFGSNRPVFRPGDTGGEVSYEQWFRGPAAFFGGLEYRPNDRWGFKLEYSSDDYVTETQASNVFDLKSRINYGIEYQASPRTRLGAYYLYGSEIGLSAQFSLNPYVPGVPVRVAAPEPILPRPAYAESPEAYSTDWAQSALATPTMRDVLVPQLEASGLVLESLTLNATTAELRFRNLRYRSMTNAVGRAARALAQVMPASVETFRLVPMSNGLPLSATVVRRSDLEALEFDSQPVEALQVLTGFEDAMRRPAGTTAVSEDLYPGFTWSLGPYTAPAYFDPDVPLRIDLGIEATASYQPAPGWVIAGALRHRLVGNVADSDRTSNSVLPRVRTDQVLYAQADTTLDRLYAARYWRPGSNLYARVTGGYLESMFGGISSEVLWKPVSSRLALGVEANYVRQRDYDQRFGFRDYSVLTGHASAYMDLGRGFLGQVDVGRYLAGDYGATFSLDRTFDNGWSVGGFFTLTNVSAEDFGEGSFDKGIRFSIPVGWFLGTTGKQGVGTTIRPIQRDGGQRLDVPGRLYGQVRQAHRQALEGQWARFWQ